MAISAAITPIGIALNNNSLKSLDLSTSEGVEAIIRLPPEEKGEIAED